MAITIIGLESDVSGADNCCLKLSGSDCSDGPLIDVQILDKPEKIQIQHIMPSVKFFCTKHLETRIHLFAHNQRHCVDPLNKHTSYVKTNLCAVSRDIYAQYEPLITLIPGQKLCKQCLYNWLPKWYSENHISVSRQASGSSLSTQTTNSSYELSLSPPFINSQCEIENSREAITTIAKTLQISPIKASERFSKVISAIVNRNKSIH